MMQTIVNKYKYDFVFRIFAMAIACYLLARTYYIDITDDEAWSYYNVKNFWWVETLCSGNTHWFNFAAIKAALLFGFEKVWQIRWFSVLSGLTFLWITYWWVKTIPKFPLKLFAFSFVFLNPYLLEYLILARGYSSALCFLVLSLALFFKALFNENKFSYQLVSLVFAGFSAIANFNFFYFFVMFCMVYFCRFYYHKYGFQFFKQKWFYLNVAYAIGITILVLRALLFIKECSNDIGAFGGEEFVPAIFYSFIDKLFYGNALLTLPLKAGLGWAFFVLILSTSIYGIVKLNKHHNMIYFYSSIILLGMLVLVVVNKWFFNVLYPTDRTTLMFYPLIAVVLIGFMQSTLVNAFLKDMMLYVLSVFLVLNFSWNFSFSWGYDHDYCHNVEPGFNYLKKVKSEKIGITSDLYFVFLKYYQQAGYSYNGEAVNALGRPSRFVPENKLEDFDYLLLRPPYNLSYYKSANVKLEGVKFFEPSKLLIVKVHNLNQPSHNL